MAALTTLFCSALLLVGAVMFVSADQNIITAESGQNITLTCRAPNNNPIIVVEWSRRDLRGHYVLMYRDEQLDPENQHPSFKNRVDLQDRQMKDGDVSLILKNVTTDDNGTYECRVVQGIRKPMRVINSLYLSVVPPGQPGRQEKGGSLGLSIGLSHSAVLLLAVVFFIHRQWKQQQSQGSDAHPDAQFEMSV